MCPDSPDDLERQAREAIRLFQDQSERWSDREAFLADPDHAHLREILTRLLLNEGDSPPDADATVDLNSDDMDQTIDFDRSQREVTTPSRPSMPASQLGVTHPEEIGPYKLIELLGEGGFGAVYRAEQRGDVRRSVALKIIKKGMDSEQVLARFDAEKNALILMNHPNISRVLDSGQTEDGQPYFVMEYVDGAPITEYCKHESLSLEDRLSLFQQVCEGIQHAHSKAVVHRDLKPANILVTRQDGKPVPKIIDFGLAKALGGALTEKTVVTQQRQILGTLEYMSPEQARSGGSDIDTKTDVYALGVVLYELLVDVRPFDLRNKSDWEMLRIIEKDDPPRPSQRFSSLQIENSGEIALSRGLDQRNLAQKLSGELDWIVLKALEKNRDRRYETPIDLSEDVGRYLAGNEPVTARPPSMMYRARKFGRRYRVALSALLMVFVALAVGFGWALFERNNARINESLAMRSSEEAQRQKSLAEAAKVTALENEQLALEQKSIAEAAFREAEQERNNTTAALKKAERNAYFGQIQAAYGALKAQDIASVYQSLDSCPENLRDWEWNHIRNSCDSSLQTIKIESAGPVFGLQWSPDSSLFAVGSWDGRLRIYDGKSGDLIHNLNVSEKFVEVLVWDPDGNRIATAGGDRAVKIWNARTGALLKNFEIDQEDQTIGSSWSLAWDPNGTRLASGYVGGKIIIWDLETETRLHTLTDSGVFVYGLAWHPTKPELIAGNDQSTISVWNPDSGELLQAFSTDQIEILCCSFSPSGDRLITAGNSTDIKVWDTSTWQLLQTLEGHSKSVECVDFNPDGSAFASVSHDRTIRLWETDSGESLQTLTGHIRPVYEVSWSRDGDRLLSGSFDEVKIWHEVTQLSGFSLTETEKSSLVGALTSAVLSADGSLVAGGTNEGSIYIWDASNGELLQVWGGYLGGGPIRWHPTEHILLIGTNAGTIALWDLAAAKPPIYFKHEEATIDSVTWSPDGTLFAASVDQRIQIYPSRTRESLQTLEGASASISDIDWSPDGKFMASSLQNGSVMIHDVSSGEILSQYSPNYNREELWSAGTLELEALVLEWNPQGTQIAVGYNDFKIRLWDKESGEIQQVFSGHTGEVLTLSWNPAGNRFVSGSSDGNIRIWGVDTGTSLLTLGVLSGQVFEVDWDTGGESIVACDSKNNVRILHQSAYKERSTTVLGFQNALDLLSPLVQAQIDSGADQPTIRTWLANNRSLTPVQRRAASFLILDTLDVYGNNASTLVQRASKLLTPNQESSEADLDLGLKMLQSALRLEPGRTLTLDSMAWVLLEQGEYDQALEIVEKAATAFSNEPKTFFWEQRKEYFDTRRKQLFDRVELLAPSDKGENE